MKVVHAFKRPHILDQRINIVHVKLKLTYIVLTFVMSNFNFCNVILSSNINAPAVLALTDS